LEPPFRKGQSVEVFVNELKQLFRRRRFGGFGFYEAEDGFLGRVFDGADCFADGDEGFNGVDFSCFEFPKSDLVDVGDAGSRVNNVPAY
jgi:hypothetical protein